MNDLKSESDCWRWKSGECWWGGEQRFERESEKSGKILSVMKMMKWWLYRVWMLTKLDSVKFLQVQIGWRL